MIVLQDESGTEAYAGPACAKKHAGEQTEPVLDLSKLAMLLVIKSEPEPEPEPEAQPDETDPQSDQSSKKSKKRQRTQAIQLDDATNYLRLRAEFMHGFMGQITSRLKDFHDQLGEGAGLSDDARLYLDRLLAKAKTGNTIYSLRNVELCLGAAFWLRVAIENTQPERRDFLEKMLASLKAHWRLSQKQVEAINRWGDGVRKRVPDFPVLDTKAFEGVQSPRFDGSKQ